ncbi:hypothetical protein SUDANB145_05199 [Streptomyces sp. enrichment culture]|uniref:hypothetical protein n=1 Tax=Streptomyces sp. enrichment culture TaxID=1795815 RepID=UPI003F5445CE
MQRRASVLLVSLLVAGSATGTAMASTGSHSGSQGIRTQAAGADKYAVTLQSGTSSGVRHGDSVNTEGLATPTGFCPCYFIG